VITAGGAWLIGLPNPVLLGAIAFLCNYIPYIGPAFVVVVLFGHLTGRRHPSQAGSALTLVLAGWHGFSRWQSLGCRMGRPKSFRMS